MFILIIHDQKRDYKTLKIHTNSVIVEVPHKIAKLLYLIQELLHVFENKLRRNVNFVIVITIVIDWTLNIVS